MSTELGAIHAVEDHRRLDVRALHRAAVLEVGYQCDWQWQRANHEAASIGLQMVDSQHLRLHYQLTRRDKAEQLDYKVPITWTPCHLGGKRPWFLCPCCGCRVAILYLNRVFACRQCLHLNYTSQQASKRDLALEMSWKLRRALGCELGLMDLAAECIPRPKRMHRRTFDRKIAQLQQVDARVLDSLQQQVAGLERRLRSIDKQLGSR